MWQLKVVQTRVAGRRVNDSADERKGMGGIERALERLRRGERG